MPIFLAGWGILGAKPGRPNLGRALALADQARGSVRHAPVLCPVTRCVCPNIGTLTGLDTRPPYVLQPLAGIPIRGFRVPFLDDGCNHYDKRC